MIGRAFQISGVGKGTRTGRKIIEGNHRHWARGRRLIAITGSAISNSAVSPSGRTAPIRVKSHRPSMSEPPVSSSSGGPQYVSQLDRFPYLRDEMAYIDTVMKADVPLLGICLGGQLIAATLGASVNFHPEGNVALGYYPLRVTDAGRGLVFQTI